MKILTHSFRKELPSDFLSRITTIFLPLVIAGLSLMRLLNYSSIAGAHQPMPAIILILSLSAGFLFDITLIIAVIMPVLLVYTVFVLLLEHEMIRTVLAFIIKVYVLMTGIVSAILLWIDHGFISYFGTHLDNSLGTVLGEDARVITTVILGRSDLMLLMGSGLVLSVTLYLMLNGWVVRALPDGGAASQPQRRVIAVVSTALILMAIAGSSYVGARAISRDTRLMTDMRGICLADNALSAFARVLGNAIGVSPSRVITATGYGKDIRDAFADFLGLPAQQLMPDLVQNLMRRTPVNPAIEKLKPDVVLVLMEGFSADLAAFDSPRFNILGELGRHFKEDLLFSAISANEMHTNGCLETIFMNIPPTSATGFLLSQKYFRLADYPLGALLPYVRAGYETTYLGAGTYMNDSSFASLGIEHVHTMKSVCKQLKRPFAVDDENLFEYALQLLKKPGGKPQFIVIMTETNHAPYDHVPADFRPSSLEVTPELWRVFSERIRFDDRAEFVKGIRAYRYSSQRAGEFVSAVKSLPLHEKTIIAITGDHSSCLLPFGPEPTITYQQVPLYLYVPVLLRPPVTDLSVPGSQMDIMPTLYNRSLSGATYYAMGVDLFDPGLPHAAVYAPRSEVMTRDSIMSCFPDSVYLRSAKHTADRCDELPFWTRRIRAAIAIKEYIVSRYRRKS